MVFGDKMFILGIILGISSSTFHTESNCLTAHTLIPQKLEPKPIRVQLLTPDTLLECNNFRKMVDFLDLGALKATTEVRKNVNHPESIKIDSYVQTKTILQALLIGCPIKTQKLDQTLQPGKYLLDIFYFQNQGKALCIQAGKYATIEDCFASHTAYVRGSPKMKVGPSVPQTLSDLTGELNAMILTVTVDEERMDLFPVDETKIDGNVFAGEDHKMTPLYLAVKDIRNQCAQTIKNTKKVLLTVTQNPSAFEKHARNIFCQDMGAQNCSSPEVTSEVKAFSEFVKIGSTHKRSIIKSLLFDSDKELEQARLGLNLNSKALTVASQNDQVLKLNQERLESRFEEAFLNTTNTQFHLLQLTLLSGFEHIMSNINSMKMTEIQLFSRLQYALDKVLDQDQKRSLDLLRLSMSADYQQCFYGNSDIGCTSQPGYLEHTHDNLPELTLYLEPIQPQKALYLRCLPTLIEAKYLILKFNHQAAKLVNGVLVFHTERMPAKCLDEVETKTCQKFYTEFNQRTEKLPTHLGLSYLVDEPSQVVYLLNLAPNDIYLETATKKKVRINFQAKRVEIDEFPMKRLGTTSTIFLADLVHRQFHHHHIVKFLRDHPRSEWLNVIESVTGDNPLSNPDSIELEDVVALFHSSTLFKTVSISGLIIGGVISIATIVLVVILCRRGTCVDCCGNLGRMCCGVLQLLCCCRCSLKSGSSLRNISHGIRTDGQRLYQSVTQGTAMRSEEQ